MKIKRVLALTAWMAAIALMCFACSDDDLDIKQVYGFDLETMPVQKRIAEGETAEIRCRLVLEGEYDETRYYIRYFQFDGKGELRTDDGMLLAPNDLYPLENMVFRLYYTSRSVDQHNITVFIEDNYGQVIEKSFSFQNDGADDEEETE